MTPIQPLDRTSPTFRADVDTLFETDLPLLTVEINDVLAQLTGAEASEIAAAASAASAAASAESASQVANSAKWVSGANYGQGANVWSPMNFQTYRRKVAGSGSLDPSLDSANWRGLSGQANFDPIPMAALNIDLSLGNYFTKTITANSAFTFSNIPAGGSSWTLELKMDGGSAAFPASVRSVDGVARSMAAGKTHRIMFVTSNGGAAVGMVIAPNFAN